MDTEQRQSQRKELRVRARLTMDGAEPLWVQTADIGKFGMGLARIPEALKSGAQGLAAFEVMLKGEIQSVSVRMRIAYCIPAGIEYSAGIQFLDLQSPGALLIAQYVEE